MRVDVRNHANLGTYGRIIYQTVSDVWRFPGVRFAGVSDGLRGERRRMVFAVRFMRIQSSDSPRRIRALQETLSPRFIGAWWHFFFSVPRACALDYRSSVPINRDSFGEEFFFHGACVVGYPGQAENFISSFSGVCSVFWFWALFEFLTLSSGMQKGSPVDTGQS